MSMGTRKRRARVQVSGDPAALGRRDIRRGRYRALRELSRNAWGEPRVFASEIKLTYVPRVDLRARSRARPSPVPRELLDRAATLTEAMAALATHSPEFECLVFVDRHRTETSLTLA